jgi:hypothetical protein
MALAASAGAGFGADARPPQQPPAPTMQIAQVGPRTEPVDEKAYAGIVYVAPGGADGGAGGSRTAPLATVSGALAKISDAAESKRYAIFVSGGEYDDAIAMKPFVDVFGGFDAKSWRRDIDGNRSILDGQHRQRIVVGADAARLDGFVIRNGTVRGPGGAILCDHASPVISNNTIVNNATLEPEGFEKLMIIHQRGNDGGGIACMNGASPVIRNNVIAANTTEVGDGGGVAVVNASLPKITNNVIIANHSGLADITRSRSSNGGAIAVSQSPNRPPGQMTICNNVIANNRVGGDSDAGGIYLEYDSAPLIAGNWIVGNLAEDDGGGLYAMKSAHPRIVNNVFAGNKGQFAIVLSKSGLADIEHNVFHANFGGVSCHNSWMQLTQNTIVGNRGPGVSYTCGDPRLKGPLVTRNIIYANAGETQIEEQSETPMIARGNDVQGGYRGEGNVDDPPSFGDDRAYGQISSISYDALLGTSTLTSADVSSEKLAGRVLNLGTRWGVIRNVDGGRISAWGDLRPIDPSDTRFEIVHTYQLRRPAAGGAGATSD